MLDQISVSLDSVVLEQRLLARRLHELHASNASPTAWRLLQYDARCALVHSQVRLEKTRRGPEIVEDQDAARRESIALSICIQSLQGLLYEVTEALAVANAN